MHTLPIKYDKGSGRPLILLHGLGNNYKSWSFALGNIDNLSQRVIVLDLLGFGDAPKPDVKYTPKDHAEAVIRTLDKHGISEFALAGHSMGCVVAIEIATSHPKRVDKLYLFGAPIYKRKKKGRYFKLFKIVKKNPEAIKAGGQLAEELMPFVKGIEVTDKTWPAYRLSLENTIMQTETYKQAEDLKIPALFVSGLLDFFIVRGNIKRLQRKNPRYVKMITVLGPHELTPRQGKLVGRILST